MSRPASPPRNDTRETHAPTQNSRQPLDYFYEGERTTSPPPVALEKAMDPSLSCHPETPAASSISVLSRSSTLNSSSTTETQDSVFTRSSQSSASSDDTVSNVSRSLTLPAMGSNPVDPNSPPKGASIRVFELRRSWFEQYPLFPYGSSVSGPISQSSPGRINRYLSWPRVQDEEIPMHRSQTRPPRHLTFPIGSSRSRPQQCGPRSPTKLEDTHSFIFEGNEDTTVPESSSMSHPVTDNAITSATDMRYDVFRQEMPPDEGELHSFQAQPDGSVTSSLFTGHKVTDSPDFKHASLCYGTPPYPSVESPSQRRRKLSRDRPIIIKAHKGTERAMIVTSRQYKTYTEPVCSRGSSDTVFSTTSTIVNSEAAMELEGPSGIEFQKQADDKGESSPSSPRPRKKPSHERSRESCSPESDDNTSFPHEDSCPESEEDEDFAYNRLVESITNLVLESSCVGNVEERGVPVELYVHNLLEQVLNHTKLATDSQAFCLPFRSRSMQKKETPCDAGEPCSSAYDQGGNGGSSGRHKRKSNEAPHHTRDHSDGAEETPDGSSEEVQSSNSQQAKKLKTGRKGHNLSCPFRKRNPIRFNVRSHSHGSCALNSFADFALLKRHIKTFHQKAKHSISCVRCKKAFADQAALNHHLTQPEFCELITSTGDEDPEDGITDEVDLALKVRTKDDNIRSWPILWNRLFPDDKPEDIPSPDFEPPVELDEVQKQYYDEDFIREFVRNLPGDALLTEYGFWYIVHGLRHFHKPSKKRGEQDQQFWDTVRNALFLRQCALGAQQTHPPHGFAQNGWGPGYNGTMPFGNGLDVFSMETYPSFPIYATHHGFDGSHISAPSTLDPSSQDAAHPAPPHPSMNYPLVAMQNGRPCPAAEGSAHRSSAQYSSGPSSQSRDSGEQTQETQDTQYTQEHDAALQHNYYPSHAYDGRAGDHGGPCSCSTSPGGIPAGQHSCASAIPGQEPSELSLCGIGEGTSMQQAQQSARPPSSLMPPDCLYVSNSDED